MSTEAGAGIADRLGRLLRPASVAVAGGSWAEAVIRSCQEMGFQGAIWPLHPKKQSICGIPAFSKISDLPAPPDAVFLGVNRQLTISMLDQFQAMGAGGAVAFASGFAEVNDGAGLQQQLVEAAAAMPVLGPNCYGLINYLDGALLWPDLHGGKRVKSGVAIITQSSNLAINLTMQQGGLPIAYLVTLGNQAMISQAEVMDALISDDRVTAIGLHIEGIRDAGLLAAAVAKARNASKPVIALKVGSSDAARQMALSHTASLAGSHRIGQAFLQQQGIGSTHSIEGFLQALGLAHQFGMVPDCGLVTLSCSGGEASLIADAAERGGVAMPDFSPEAAAAITLTVNPLVTVSNPFDYHTFDWGDAARLEATFKAVLSAHQGLTCLVIDFPTDHPERDQSWQVALDAFAAARDACAGMAMSERMTASRAIVLASMADTLTGARAEAIIANGMGVLRGFDAAIEAIAALQTASQVKTAMPSSLPVGIGRLLETPKLWDEWQAKQWLADGGIAVPCGRRCSSLDEAQAFARPIFDRGGRVVCKILGLAHKTEQGGVILGIEDMAGLDSAFSRLTMIAASGHAASAGMVLVEEMIENAIAEMIIGFARDPQFGLHMIIGAGGVLAELIQDTAVLILPASEQAIDTAIERLAINTLLEGWRNAPAADRKALVGVVLRLQQLVLDLAESLDTLDINPLLILPACSSHKEEQSGTCGKCTGDSVVAVDILLSRC